MSKNKKLAVIISSSCLVIILVVLSMVSSANPMDGGPGLACTPGGWVKRTDFGNIESGARLSAVSFSIGTKGYIGTGVKDENTTTIYYKDFWEYNPATNVWTQKDDFKGGERFGAIGFSIGGKGYIGTGINNENHTVTYYKDFYEYNPSTNTWTQKKDFGGSVRYESISFSIGTKGYVGFGRSGTNGTFKDFWEYNPATDNWTPKANFIGIPRLGALGFSIGTKGYVGLGIQTNEFWSYDPATDNWTPKANFGGGARWYATGFSIGSKGYIGLGSNGTQSLKDFWEYNPATDNWTPKANFGGKARIKATGFSIASKGYVGTGNSNSQQQGSFKDFWEYCPGIAN